MPVLGDQHRPAAFHGQPVGDIESVSSRPLRVGLAGDHEVGGVGVREHAIGDTESSSVVIVPLGHKAATAGGGLERRPHRGVLCAIELAVSIDDDGRTERSRLRDDDDRRHHREADQMRLEGLRQARGWRH
jgi:hypothetical protein